MLVYIGVFLFLVSCAVMYKIFSALFYHIYYNITSIAHDHHTEIYPQTHIGMVWGKGGKLKAASIEFRTRHPWHFGTDPSPSGTSSIDVRSGTGPKLVLAAGVTCASGVVTADGTTLQILTFPCIVRLCGEDATECVEGTKELVQ